ncbi:MAG: 4Fe-4S dicluster domain-containing protein [Planctomycetota bacterium]|nr:MAG: 4Fe-4S dicluster domain-containing protein [Planctomycetota bacterium]
MTTTQQQQDLFDLLDAEDFRERIVGCYNAGTAEEELPADLSVARSLIAPGTAALRDFSYIAPDIPVLDHENCVGCMECVTECPDTAILAKVVPAGEYERRLAAIDDPAEKEQFAGHFNRTRKYWDAVEKKGGEPGMFGIFIDPTKCKGCAECVEVCGDHQALHMEPKDQRGLDWFRTGWRHFRELPDTPDEYISERVLTDMMLSAEAVGTYVGGAGSCMGCGEATALRMMLAATAFVHGKDNIGLVAATGCNTVYASTYPYNPYTVPWMNSLFENAATTAAGVRLRWNQMGWNQKKLWALGGDGGMFDIGFQALSRLLASGLDVNVLILDTQVYSNTGGQTSTASFFGQEAKLSAFGKARPGKVEKRKEAAQIAMMHPDVYVAQTTCAHPNHFYRAVMGANEYPGPAVIVVYNTCQPEHGVGDNMSSHQAKLAVETRAFPLLIHDPRAGESLAERISLKGNPALKEDWATDPRTGQPLTFVDFARTEGRFRKHFDQDGNPDQSLLDCMAQRLQNWRQLQELAGLR